MNIFQPVQATIVEIEIKAKEKAAFTRFWQETDNNFDPPRTIEHSKREKFGRLIYHYKQPIFPIPNGQLMPGTYNIDFQFILPTGLPSSIYYKDKRTREHPKAKIKYWVKAKVIGRSRSDEMKHKQIIAIREPPVQFKMNEQQGEVANLKTWCCIDQGTSHMWVNYEKNIYTPQEVCRAFINIDNSNCTLNCTQVKFWLEQRLTLHSRGFGNHSHTMVKKLTGSEKPGPNFGQKEYQTEMYVDLNKIIMENIPEFKKKKGVEVRLSPEDAFMMKCVQPATHSRHITNEYFLKIECTYEGCTCCSNVPDTSMPMTIVPIVNPACIGF